MYQHQIQYIPSTSGDMRNEIDFPSAPQEISRKQYPLRNRSQPKAIEKHSGVTKITEVKGLHTTLVTFEKKL